MRSLKNQATRSAGSSFLKRLAKVGSESFFEPVRINPFSELWPSRSSNRGWIHAKSWPALRLKDRLSP